jgi:hypothetical protein
MLRPGVAHSAFKGGIMESKEKSVGAFWLKTGKNGKKFMSGSLNIKEIAEQTQDIEKVSVIMFKNTYKQEGDKSPDYKLFLSKPKDESAKLGLPPEETTELEPF